MKQSRYVDPRTAHTSQRLDVRTLPKPPAWTENALCAQVGGDEWFPEFGSGDAEAKAVCGRCDVQVACLTYALANDERYGIWGGLSTSERGQLGGGA